MGKQGIALAVAAIAFAAPNQASAAKIDAGDVKNAATVITDVPLDFPGGSPPTTGGAYVSCPAGTQAFTGGAYMYPTGQQEKPTAVIFTRVVGSSATGDGNGWYADGVNGSYTPAMTLRIVLRCLPAQKLVDATLVQDTASVADGEADSVEASCPRGDRAFTGGSFWHQPGMGPAPAVAGNAWSSSSTPTGDADGWYADGRSFGSYELTAYAWCLPKHQLAGYTAATSERKIDPNADKIKNGSCPNSHPAAAAAGSFLHKPGKGPSEANADDSILYSVGVLEGTKRFTAGGRNIDSPNLRLAARAFCLAK